MIRLLLAFICLELLLAFVQHEHRKAESGVIVIQKNGRVRIWIPRATPEPQEPADRYTVIPELYPRRTI